MISDIISFKKGEFRIDDVLIQSEKAAEYGDLHGKSALHLRLLSEEICCMIDVLVQSFEGEFWIDAQGKNYSLYVSLNTDSMNLELKKKLIRSSTTRANASAKGLIGRIRSVVENFSMINEGNVMNTYEYGADSSDMMYSSAWLFSEYKSDAQSACEPVIWDELEKSILAKIADEIIVGVKGNKIEIVVKKDFSEKKV